ncbi:MAG: VOC family protein [Hydrococcus sp. Prado102]|jgi:predicted enzyme related to lactoylglutathione lyase|nr:VOC family protein [Hydrococcus sp. Prado102]
MTFEYTDVFVALAATELETLVQFYSRLLALEPKAYLPDSYAEFQLSGGLRLSIFKPEEKNYQEFASAKSSTSLCLEVEDLENAIAHITEMGYPPPGEIAIASHGREIYAYDPLGTRIIFYQSY